MLLAAGIETTTNLLSNSLLVLADRPDTRARLADDRSLLPSAVEELLRYDTPVPEFFRTLSRDVDLHGTTMPEGSKVLLMYGAANRDDRVFGDPDRFDIDPTGEPHLAFSHGAHFCLGAALARIEAGIVLGSVLDAAPAWDVDFASAVRLHTPYARGFESLPVDLHWAG
jgi:cytochrome P450